MAQSYEVRYAAMKRAQEDARANSPEAVAWRLRDNRFRAIARAEQEAAIQAHKDAGTLTPDAVMELVEDFNQRVYDLHTEAR